MKIKAIEIDSIEIIYDKEFKEYCCEVILSDYNDWQLSIRYFNGDDYDYTKAAVKYEYKCSNFKDKMHVLTHSKVTLNTLSSKLKVFDALLQHQQENREWLLKRLYLD